MHKEIEVYVDDMITKSHTEVGHIEDLLKLFQRLRKYRLRLNPNKCTFGVRSGKLLGFIVSQKGIKVDPDKVKAIQEMPAPRTEKQVRGCCTPNFDLRYHLPSASLHCKRFDLLIFKIHNFFQAESYLC